MIANVILYTMMALSVLSDNEVQTVKKVLSYIDSLGSFEANVQETNSNDGTLFEYKITFSDKKGRAEYISPYYGLFLFDGKRAMLYNPYEFDKATFFNINSKIFDAIAKNNPNGLIKTNSVRYIKETRDKIVLELYISSEANAPLHSVRVVFDNNPIKITSWESFKNEIKVADSKVIYIKPNIEVNPEIFSMAEFIDME